MINKSKYILLSLTLLGMLQATEETSAWQYPGTEEEAFMDPAADEDLLLEEYELAPPGRLAPPSHPRFEKQLNAVKAALQDDRKQEANRRKDIADRLLPKYAERQYALAKIKQEIEQSPSSILLYEKQHIEDESDWLKDQIKSRLLFANDKRRSRAQAMQDIKEMELSFEKWRRGES